MAAEAVLRLRTRRWSCPGDGRVGRGAPCQGRGPEVCRRHVLLPAVHPDEVPLWAASADASINRRAGELAQPAPFHANKFWESSRRARRSSSVTSSGHAGDRGGQGPPRCHRRPGDPDDLARALADIVDQPAPGSPDAIGLRVCRERYNWETAVVPYLELVGRLKQAMSRSDGDQARQRLTSAPVVAVDGRPQAALRGDVAFLGASPGCRTSRPSSCRG